MPAKSATPTFARFSRSIRRPPQRGEIDFLTMEFLEGETLAERTSPWAAARKPKRSPSRGNSARGSPKRIAIR